MAVGRRVTVYRGIHCKVEYDIDSYRKGIRKLARGPELRAVVMAVCEKAKPYAISVSPKRSGTYRRSFKVTGGTTVWGIVQPMRRAYGRLSNTSYYAVHVEWGTAEHRTARGLTSVPAYRVLTKTLQKLEHLRA